jgi:hypothetical protein
MRCYVSRTLPCKIPIVPTDPGFGDCRGSASRTPPRPSGIVLQPVCTISKRDRLLVKRYCCPSNQAVTSPIESNRRRAIDSVSSFFGERALMRSRMGLGISPNFCSNRRAFLYERSLISAEIANDRGLRPSQNQTELHQGHQVERWIRY